MRRVDANDVDEGAVKCIKRNVEFNGPAATAMVHATQVAFALRLLVDLPDVSTS